MSKDEFKQIWSTDDFRAAVVAIRALGAPETGAVAPVIDIRTRERIA